MKQINFLFFLFIGVFAQSQIISGKILSKEENLPIPYAKIGVEHSEIGTIADEFGNFSLDLNVAERKSNVKIEVAGFEIYKNLVENFIKQNPQNIYLVEKIKNIEEVKITPKKLVTKNWGVNTKSKSVLYSVNPKLRKDQYLRETAVEFSTKKRTKIERINLNIAGFESDKPVVLRYSVYDEKNGFPNELIIEKEIAVSITKDDIVNGTFFLDVKDESIWVNGKFFIGIQFMNDFDGRIFISAALFRPGFTRSFYGNWEKISVAAPAINIDVKVEK